MIVKIKGYKDALVYSNYAHRLFLVKLLQHYNELHNDIITASVRELLGEELNGEADEIEDMPEARLDLLLDSLEKNKKLTYQECKLLYLSLKDIQMSVMVPVLGEDINLLDKWVDMLKFCATKRVTMFID